MEKTYKWLTYWGLGTTVFVTIIVLIILALVFAGVDVSALFPVVIK